VPVALATLVLTLVGRSFDLTLSAGSVAVRVGTAVVLTAAAA
jgi:hypothetical protein